MNLPLVAIVGRPNVGKSSLFNRLCGQRIAIVEATPGVTRDRVSAIIAHQDVTMELVDTGGIGIVDRDDLDEHVERQIELAVRSANVILFVTDCRSGVTPLDRHVASRLRPRAQEITVLVVANKVDRPHLEAETHEFFALGLGDPIPVSALEGHGTEELLDRVVKKLWPTGEVHTEPHMKLAVVGRQNVGKSTFVNALAREDRVIVSEVPGTTRDAVDVHFEKDGLEFVVIDTAGVQQRRKVHDSVQFYSQVRTEHAVRRAHVVLFLLDATKEITRADKAIGDLIASNQRACICVANKWDLTAGKITTDQYAEYLTKRLPALHYAPVVFTTAADSKNIQSVVDLAQHLFKKASRRVTTGELNRVIEAIQSHHRPRVRKQRVPKVFFATQVATCPPSFVVFVNEPRLFPADYRRYVENSLREAFPFFDEIPLRVLFRRRESLYKD